MKKISDKRKKWLEEYHAQIERDDWIQQCELCGLRTSKNVLQRHHPKRRLGKNILHYIYVCYICHEDIERGRHPELLPRDNSGEKRFHSTGPEDNMLKTNEKMKYDIQEIKDKINIVEVCRKLGLDCPSKTDFHMLCPSHNEKTPSFHVYKNATRFYCFGCGESGDVINFYKLVTGEENNKKAIEDVANLANVGAVSPARLMPPAGSGIKRATLPEEEEAPRDILYEEGSAIPFPEPKELVDFRARKKISSSVINKLCDERSIKFDKNNRMIFVYPNGLKIRTDYGSSRGDRWLFKNAGCNIWRSEGCSNSKVQDIYITEGESDLMTLFSHMSEMPFRKFIAFPGASTRLREMEAYKIGFERSVCLLFDNDDAGRECTKEAAKILHAEGAKEVLGLDWLRIERIFPDKTLKDLGDIPYEVLINIDTFLIKV